MSTETEKLLNDIVVRLLAKGKFDTRIAARAAIGAALRLDGLRQIDVPHNWRALFIGYQTLAKDIRGPISDAADEIARDNDGQGTLGFARMIHLPAAFDEHPRTRRMMPIDMNYDQWTALIDFRLKKARESRQAAKQMQDFKDEHPEWASKRHLTAGEIIGLEAKMSA